MERSLDPVGEAVQDFPGSELRVKLIRHPEGDMYHVEARLRLLERSRSWRITAPLRAFTRWLGGS